MAANVLFRVSCSIVFCIGSFLALPVAGFAVTIAAAGSGGSDFIEVFCGSPIPAIHRTVTRPPVEGPVTIDVSIANFAFDPSTLMINVGDTVRWTNNDTRTHTTSSDSSVWDSGGIAPGGTFSFTFISAGAFPYHCNIHPFMTASVTVSGGSTPTPTDTPTNTPSNTPTNTPTSTATNTPTFTPTNTPTSTPTQTPTDSPSATPTGTPAINGTITYGNAVPAGTRFVSNVTITGGGSPTVMTTTAAPGATAGQYSLTGFGAGSYTVTPTKTTGANSITSFDAAKVAQHVAGAVPLTGNQLVVADVSDNGSISSFDAGQIAKFVTSAPPFGITGTWKFFTVPNVPFPAGSTPTSRTYPSVSGSISGQDYTALLMGEVSGNWTNSGARPANAAGPARAAAINAPNLVTSSKHDVLLPIAVQGAAEKGIISYQFDLRYDPSVLEPQANPVDLAGTVSSRLSVVTNAAEPGLLRVAVYGAVPMDANGVLLNLRFTPIGAAGAVSPLTWEKFMLNEGDPMLTASDGSVELSRVTGQ